MNYIYSDEPIIACSSGGKTNTAIAIIRLSGFTSLEKLDSFFSISYKKIQPRYAHFVKILDGSSVLDEIVLTYFEGPNSYNGENILELSVHGNIFNIERIINLFINHSDFRYAHPGEFSYRALKNKKLSLSQVEGLDLLLNASSPFTLKQGFSLLSGKLQDDYNELYTSFLNHKSAVELSIDFLDDIGEENSEQQFNETLTTFSNVVNKLKHRVTNNSHNLVSPDIVLVGEPNAGKSSLFNTFLLDNRAIVSDIAGTTRDYISENIRIGDSIFNLIDTAGMRVADNSIEVEGIKRSYNLIQKGFYKILVINPFSYNKDFLLSLSAFSFDLIILSHGDVEAFDEAVDSLLVDVGDVFNLTKNKFYNFSGPMGALRDGSIEPENSGPMGANDSGSIEPLFLGPIGANLKINNPDFLNFTFNLINNKYLDISNKEPIAIDRHINSINEIYLKLQDYSNISSNSTDISIISSELNIVGHCVSELIGIVSPDDVLHNIFDNFCIGK